MPKELCENSQEGCYDGHGKKFVVIFLMVLLTAIVASGVFYYLTKSQGTQNIYVGSTPEKNKIDVSGTAKMTVSPNLAQISLGVETQEKTAKEAQTKNADLMSKVMKSLKDNEIKDEDIKTTRFSTQAVTEGYWACPENKLNCSEDDEIWKTKIVGYKTTHALLVETDQLTKVGEIVDDAIDQGANDLDGVTFTLKEETLKQLRQQLLSGAVSEAKNKAERIANAAGVKLLTPISISESYSYYPTNYYMDESKALAGDAPSSELSAGTIDVSASVSASYEIGSQ